MTLNVYCIILLDMLKLFELKQMILDIYVIDVTNNVFGLNFMKFTYSRPIIPVTRYFKVIPMCERINLKETLKTK